MRFTTNACPHLKKPKDFFTQIETSLSLSVYVCAWDQSFQKHELPCLTALQRLEALWWSLRTSCYKPCFVRSMTAGVVIRFLLSITLSFLSLFLFPPPLELCTLFFQWAFFLQEQRDEERESQNRVLLQLFWTDSSLRTPPPRRRLIGILFTAKGLALEIGIPKGFTSDSCQTNSY